MKVHFSFFFVFIFGQALAASSVGNLKNILEDQAEVLDRQVQFKAKNGFSLSKINSDFSFSRSGILGFSAVKASKAIEIRWEKKKGRIQKEDNSNDIVIKKEADIQKAKYLILSLALNKYPKLDARSLENELTNRLGNLQELVNDMLITQSKHWVLSGLRVDLSIDISGKIWMFTKAGAELRVRLEWAIVAPSSKVTQYSHSSIFINTLLHDMEYIFGNKDYDKFDISTISIGLGVTQKGTLGIVSSKTALMGYLIFKPNSQGLKQNLIFDKGEDIPLIVESKEKGPIRWLRRRISRKRWLNSLYNSAYLSETVSKNMIDGKSWYISNINNIFSISHTGFLGFANSTGNSSIDVNLKRKEL